MEFLDAQKLKELAEKERYFAEGIDDSLNRAWIKFLSKIHEAADEYMKFADRWAGGEDLK